MPFPSRLAAQRRVRLHRGPKKGRWPIRTLPAFPARLLACPDHPANRPTSRCFARTLDPGLLARATPLCVLGSPCDRDGVLALPTRCPLSIILDTARSGFVPGGVRALICVILALCGLRRNGTGGVVARDP